jgi:polyisoprenoid-binding protein YceI
LAILVPGLLFCAFNRTGHFAAPPQARAYTIVAAESSLTVFVGKAGLLSALGHDHIIAAKSFGGRAMVPASDLGQGSLEFEVEAKSLVVADQGISDKERNEIQEAMHAVVLETSRFPKIGFRSVSIANLKPSGEGQSFTLNGDLTLHGVTRRVAVPVIVTITSERLRATGEITIKQTDFGIKPYSAGLGSVKVKDAVKLSFAITAQAA